MPVRKTESRIPDGSTAADLGQEVVAGDGRCAMVSFITSPLAVGRENRYVVFVTDASLAANAESYEWTFTQGEDPPNTSTTSGGEIAFTPAGNGSLHIAVRILDAANAEQASLTLTQSIVTLNPVLEALISDAGDNPGAGIGNPDVVRELVNDYSQYYQGASLQFPQDGDAFRHFLFSLVFDGALQRRPPDRQQHVDGLAVALNEQTTDFATLLAQGVGVCAVRLPLLAMTGGIGSGGSAALLDWTELPDVPNKREVAEEQLCQAVGALGEDTLIDLFNVVRFPKSNITACSRILGALRDRYFSGTNFNDVLTGMSGTRAQWIVRHYREGPLSRT